MGTVRNVLLAVVMILCVVILALLCSIVYDLHRINVLESRVGEISDSLGVE